MIESVNSIFIEWSQWVRGDDRWGSGYGKSVIAKVMEGKGEIMPGGSKVPSRDLSPDERRMLDLERFVGGLSRRDKRLIKVFYLTSGSGEEKAKYLRIDRRTLYGRLHRIHSMFHYGKMNKSTTEVSK